MADSLRSQEENPLRLRAVEFSESELRECQLIFLTAGDLPRRLEAFRRLLLSQLDAETKAKLCFQIMEEDSMNVKREAMAALKSVSAVDRAPLLETLSTVLSDQTAAVQKALQNLRSLDLKRNDEQWVLSFLIHLIPNMAEEPTFSSLMDVVEEKKENLRLSHLPALVDHAVRSTAYQKKKIQSFLHHWADTSEKGESLFREYQKYSIDEIKDWPLKTVFHSGYRGQDVFESIVKHLCLQKDLIDPSSLSSLLISSGEKVIPLLIQKYETSIRPVYTIHTIARILNQETVTKEILQLVLDFGLREIRSTRREVFPALIGLPFASLPFSEEELAKWLRELLLVRQELSSEYLLKEVDYQIRLAGPKAYRVLKEMILYADDSTSRLHALSLISEVVPEDRETLSSIGDLFDDLKNSDRFDLGDILMSYRELWSKSAYSSDRREKEVKQFLSDLWRKSRTLERLEALAGAVAQVSSATASQIILVILDLLERRLPQIERKTSERQKYLLDNALREQRYLVAGLRGSSEAFRRQDLLPDLQERLIHLLLENWEEVKQGSVSWGPDGTRHLIRALVSLAQHQETWARQVIGTLLEELGFLETQRGLILLWDQLLDEDLRAINDWILDRFREPRTLEPDELESLLELCRQYLEKSPAHLTEESLKLLHRLKAMRRFASSSIEPFLLSLKLKDPQLLKLNDGF